MTLVVAHMMSTGVRITSDMRVTDYDRARSPGPTNAALKAVIVHPSVCVAFAGKPVEAALYAIREIDIDPHSRPNLDEVCAPLLAVQERTNLDFLVAALRPTVLLQLKAGDVKQVSSAWIGSHCAFEEFQRVYTANTYVSREIREWAATTDPPTDPQIYAAPVFNPELFEGLDQRPIADWEIDHRARTAMREVLLAGLPGVGEAAIDVSNRVREGVFVYHKTAGRVLGRDVRLGEPSVESGAERGDYSYDVLVPTDPGVGAIGIYFSHGQVGVLYHPLKLDSPQQYRAVSPVAFAGAVLEEHGFRLTGAGA